MFELKNSSKNAICIILVIIALWGLFLCCQADDDHICSKIEDEIYTTLINSGYSEAGACGILGNIAVENPNFDADLYTNNGHNYGLFQWNNVGDRLDFLFTWCNNRLLYPNRPEGQLAYALYELDGGDAYASRCNEYLKNAQSPRLAAQEFAAGFERCIGTTTDSEADGYYTGSVYTENIGEPYQALNRRMDKAAEYYEAYTGQQLESTDVLDTNAKFSPAIISEIEDRLEENAYKSLYVKLAPAKVFRSENLPHMLLSLVIGYACGCLYFRRVVAGRTDNVSNFTSLNKILTRKASASGALLKRTLINIVWDMAKTYLAFGISNAISGQILGRYVVLFAGLGVILGNDYPIWNRFRGGAGSTVTFVTLWTFMPIWGPICCLAGALGTLLSRSLAVGTVLITMFILPFAFMARGWQAGILTMIIMGISLHKHRNRLFRWMFK